MSFFQSRVFKHIKRNTQKGFTLIEMIVVIALIAILTSIILFNSSRLNSAILVSNTAYEIGLIVRESQVAGLGVKASNTGSGPSVFSSSHGVHFNLENPNLVILFADTNNSGAYEAGEMTQEFNIQNKRSGALLTICGKQTASAGSCTPANGTFITAATADVVFTRPNPEAFFKIRRTAGGALEDHSGAIILNVGFANDVCRSVIIEKTGAVQVDTSYCPPIN